MSTETVKMSLRRMNASNATSITCIEYTTSLVVGEDLLKCIKSNPFVDEMYQPISKTDSTLRLNVIAITTKPGANYIDVERELVKLITDWYEEYCGAVDTYNTLQFTLDSLESSDFSLQPNQHRPRSRYGDYKVRRAMAETIGESDNHIRAYDYLLDDLADQLGISK